MDKSKPNTLLWFMARCTFFIMPLSLMLIDIFINIGLPDNFLTSIIGIVIATYLIEAYESIHIERVEYLKRVKNEKS